MLDNLDPVTGQAPGSEKHLNLTGPTFLGSWLPPVAGDRRSLSAAGGRRSPPPLDGCLKDLELEDQAVSLVSQREPLLQQAAHVGECDQHPCTGMSSVYHPRNFFSLIFFTSLYFTLLKKTQLCVLCSVFIL